ncbi:MAG: DUF2304 domain-containing protein [Bacteroidia bacterium]|nr:DUF2304 domain-containing protein [Bacteroidia bacterium]
MERIQVIAILASLLFLGNIARLIFKGKLREEYAFIWIICTLVLLTFSIWREGLEVVSGLFGVYEAPNLVFIGAIFAILIYLLHLSVTVSRLQRQNKMLAQEMANLKEELKRRNEPVK